MCISCFIYVLLSSVPPQMSGRWSSHTSFSIPHVECLRSAEESWPKSAGTKKQTKQSRQKNTCSTCLQTVHHQLWQKSEINSYHNDYYYIACLKEVCSKTTRRKASDQANHLQVQNYQNCVSNVSSINTSHTKHTTVFDLFKVQ